ncbi:GGDEF domain-containing protein [Ammoniphilus sp. CFH 90114]|uniref:GGDEF domain-containing protein n=1 Tax=Ammoniphilus sp. CFH 90114 TaxID=2493665 RepID=UPI0013E945B4|nr:GGDEF domain-containing protein [Ammoniphilus sp. CFH 90114]
MGFHYDQAIYFSFKDPLTQAYNRRFVLRVFPKLVKKVNKEGSHFCLFILDCNNFKAINDNYGHKIGDKVLYHVSKVLMENTRTQDIVARWGGDEFLILTTMPTESAINSFQNRLHHEIAKLSHVMKLEISVSIGVSVSKGQLRSLQHMIQDTDKELYNQKQTLDRTEMQIIVQ